MDRNNLKETVSEFISKRLSSDQTKAFLFGSSLSQGKFYDIDIGVTGGVDRGSLALLKFDFEQSNFPYKVDIVNFNEVDKDFREKVMRDKILWLEY